LVDAGLTVGNCCLCCPITIIVSVSASVIGIIVFRFLLVSYY